MLSARAAQACGSANVRGAAAAHTPDRRGARTAARAGAPRPSSAEPGSAPVLAPQQGGGAARYAPDPAGLDAAAPAPWGGSAYPAPQPIEADAAGDDVGAPVSPSNTQPAPAEPNAVVIPLDHYIVLGLPLQGAGTHAIRRAAENRQQDLPLEAGYSQVR
jgi:hypothetical protein